jgi:hypothetical protein
MQNAARTRIHTRTHIHKHAHTHTQHTLTFEFFVQNGRAGTASRDNHRCVLHLGQKALHPRSMPHSHVQLVYALKTHTSSEHLAYMIAS